SPNRHRLDQAYSQDLKENSMIAAALLPLSSSPEPHLYEFNASAEEESSSEAPASQSPEDATVVRRADLSPAVRNNVGEHSQTSVASDNRRAAAEMEFAPYRGRTIWLLRRYFRTSLEIGRLPGILGREFFRSRVSSRKACSFEDEVIFATD